MSVNNPNFSVGSGDRKLDDAQQKQELLARIPKAAHIGASATPLPLNISHAVSSYQVPKTLARQIAPGPVLGGLPKSMGAHQITQLNPAALHKKEIQKVPLSLTSTSSITTIAGTAMSNIIPVQISGTGTTTATTSALHVPNVSSIVRGAVPTLQNTALHIPRGVAASVRSTSVNIHRPTIPAALSQIRSVQQIRPGTPPTNRSGSPAVSLGTAQVSDTHRATIPLHSVTAVGSGNTPSIQITLQASRTQSDGIGKPVTNLQAGKIHVNQALNMTSQPKVVMTHPVTPVIHHQTLAAKGNRGQPMNAAPLSTVTVALSTTTVTIPIISSGTTSSSTIPIAKVPPQRQHITQHPPQSHAITTLASSHSDHRGSEPSSFPQPQPAHAHTTPASQSHAHVPVQAHSTQSQPGAHGQTQNNVFMYRGSAVATTTNTQHSESRDSVPLTNMPFLPMPYMLSPENPYYQQLMRCKVEAVAQAQAQARSAIMPSITQTTSANMATLQAAVAATQNITHMTQASGTNPRFNQPLMMMHDALRQNIPHTASSQVSSGSQIHISATEASKVLTTLSSNAAALAAEKSLSHHPGLPGNTAAASSLFTAAAQSLHSQQGGHQQTSHNTSSTPQNNPNSSPRPSILRKRTHEGLSAVKKQLALSSGEVHSPRPDPRPDSTPQSNMSSPKTPASGLIRTEPVHSSGPRESPFSESQSSTDTALSSEATTPTQTHADGKIKQEIHDHHENGYANSTPEASPRKRRKQLLQATEEIKDTPVSVFDKLVEACVKQGRDIDNNNFADDDDDLYDEDDDDILSDDNRMELRDEYVDEEGIRWTLEKCRPGVALLNYYNISWKPRNNHFNRYTDVKAKDERRPTVNELSNQKGVIQKASGWKLYHMAAQIEDLFELEKELNSQLVSLQSAIGPEPPLKTSLLEDESGKIHELTQGNIQRCKLISDQLNDAKAQMLRVLEHKPKISEIISKHMSKRPIKKKERT